MKFNFMLQIEIFGNVKKNENFVGKGHNFNKYLIMFIDVAARFKNV